MGRVSTIALAAVVGSVVALAASAVVRIAKAGVPADLDYEPPQRSARTVSVYQPGPVDPTSGLSPKSTVFFF